MATVLTVKLHDFTIDTLAELKKGLLEYGCSLDIVVERSLHLVELHLKSPSTGTVCLDCGNVTGSNETAYLVSNDKEVIHDDE